MNLHVRPILSALLRNRVGAVLVAVQIAIALAVLVNAVSLVEQRAARMGRPAGFDEANLFVIASQGFTPRFDLKSALREDLAYLRRLEGVVSATPTNSAPLGWDMTGNVVWKNPQKKGPSQFFALLDMDEHGLETLGTHLIAGRGFRADEILPPLSGASEMIVTRALAQKLFPPGQALGNRVFGPDGKPITIIGITEDLLGPQGFPLVAWSPELPGGFGSFGYLVRTDPGLRDRVMREVEAHLPANPDRVIHSIRTLQYYRNLLYLSDRNMTLFLVFVTAVMIGVTCMGVFGLATYSVSTRTKQIGTRRAVGARRIDILRHFMLENWLITSTGVAAGCILALAANYGLARAYAASFSYPQPPPLHLYYLIGGVLALWLIGQLAAWHPARQAAAVSPAVATRTV